MSKMDKLSIALVLLGSILAGYAWPIALGISFNEAIDKFASSEFCMAAFGTFVAAFAGAYGAQIIVEHNKIYERNILEIRNTNAAITTSFTICNALIGLKKQHVKSIFEQFSRDLEKYNAALHQARTLPAGKQIVFHFLGDFRSLQLQKLSTDLLQSQVFSKISALGRPLALAMTLDQSANSLLESVKMRNDLISSFKTQDIKDDKLAEIYFGIKTQLSHDNVYPDLIKAISSQLDDCIYFSDLLCKDLQEHGEKIRKQIGKRAPKISKPDFSQAYVDGLMPDPNLYKTWTTSFIKAD